MKKLHLTFLNEDGTKKTLVVHCVHQDLEPEVVRDAMVQITELDLFEKDGVRLITDVYSAKYVEVIETPLFNMKVDAARNIKEEKMEPDTELVDVSKEIKEKEPEIGHMNQSNQNLLEMVQAWFDKRNQNDLRELYLYLIKQKLCMCLWYCRNQIISLKPNNY